MPSTQTLLLAAAEGSAGSVLSEEVLRDDVDLLVRVVEASGFPVLPAGADLAAVAANRTLLDHLARAIQRERAEVEGGKDDQPVATTWP